MCDKIIKLNNKGYMLVEIIMAFVITFMLVYFLMDIVIKVKNKNDDMVVETIVKTDQTIITNRLMDYVIKGVEDDLSSEEKFSCEKITVEDNMIIYDGAIIDIVDDRAVMSYDMDDDCKIVYSNEDDKIIESVGIRVNIDVTQMKDEEFDVIIDYKQPYALISYAVYSDEDNSLSFYKTRDRIEEGDTYNGKTVKKVYTGFDAETFKCSDKYDNDNDEWYCQSDKTNTIPWYSVRKYVEKVIFYDEISPVSTAYWFYGFENLKSIENESEDIGLNTENVENMEYMFSGCFNLDLSGSIIEKIDVSNVKNFSRSFRYTGREVVDFNLNLSDWSLNTVGITMTGMFLGMGYNSDKFKLEGLDNWNVKNVIKMRDMFKKTGYNATTWSIGDLSEWDVSKVTDMYYMFESAGYNADSFNLDLSKWNVSSVNGDNCMAYMFKNTGYSAQTWSIGDLSKWNVSKVTDMEAMFTGAGYSTQTWSIGDLSEWDVSSVQTMYSMFDGAGYSSKVWDIGNLSTKEIVKDNGEKYIAWDVSSVENMQNMFSRVGRNVENFSLDLSNWNVLKVSTMMYMFQEIGYDSNSVEILGLDTWDTEEVTNMESMFLQAGKNATEWNIGDIAGWNTSNVSTMQKMFYNTGSNASYSLDLSSWNVNNVTEYNNFNYGVEDKIVTPNFG